MSAYENQVGQKERIRTDPSVNSNLSMRPLILDCIYELVMMLSPTLEAVKPRPGGVILSAAYNVYVKEKER